MVPSGPCSWGAPHCDLARVGAGAGLGPRDRQQSGLRWKQRSWQVGPTLNLCTRGSMRADRVASALLPARARPGADRKRRSSGSRAPRPLCLQSSAPWWAPAGAARAGKRRPTKAGEDMMGPERLQKPTNFRKQTQQVPAAGDALERARGSLVPALAVAGHRAALW